jgi:hypothetical protein
MVIVHEINSIYQFNLNIFFCTGYSLIEVN